MRLLSNLPIFPDFSKRIHLLTLGSNGLFFSIQCNLREHLLLQGEEDDGEYDEDADPDFVPQV